MTHFGMLLGFRVCGHGQDGDHSYLGCFWFCVSLSRVVGVRNLRYFGVLVGFGLSFELQGLYGKRLNFIEQSWMSDLPKFPSAALRTLKYLAVRAL
jgi:hypothetical protein